MSGERQTLHKEWILFQRFSKPDAGLTGFFCLIRTLDSAHFVTVTISLFKRHLGVGRFSSDATQEMELSSPMGALSPPSIFDMM